MNVYGFELRFMSLMDACAVNGSNGGDDEAYGLVVWLWFEVDIVEDGNGGEARKNKTLLLAWWQVV